MLFDGRRIFFLIFLFAVLIKMIKESSIERKLFKILPIGITLFSLYAIIAGIRSGKLTIFNSTASFLEIYGVEFRDFARIVTLTTLSETSRYNYFLSAIGSFFNSKLLWLWGIDKYSFVEMGSAYYLRDFVYKIDFGIRIGHYGELYMAFGYYGLGICFLFAIIHGYFSKLAITSHSKSNSDFLFLLVSLFCLTLVGQATVFYGTVSILLYFYILHIILKKLDDGIIHHA